MSTVITITPFLAAAYFLLFNVSFLKVTGGGILGTIAFKTIPLVIGLMCLFVGLKGIGWI